MLGFDVASIILISLTGPNGVAIVVDKVTKGELGPSQYSFRTEILYW
jgi:hypothetical protein